MEGDLFVRELVPQDLGAPRRNMHAPDTYGLGACAPGKLEKSAPEARLRPLLQGDTPGTVPGDQPMPRLLWNRTLLRPRAKPFRRPGAERLARRTHRARPARGRERRADDGAKVHQGLGPVPRRGGDERLSVFSPTDWLPSP